MGSFSLAHWLVVLAIVLLLFGAGRIPNGMRDLERGKLDRADWKLERAARLRQFIDAASP